MPIVHKPIPPPTEKMKESSGEMHFVLKGLVEHLINKGLSSPAMLIVWMDRAQKIIKQTED